MKCVMEMGRSVAGGEGDGTGDGQGRGGVRGEGRGGGGPTRPTLVLPHAGKSMYESDEIIKVRCRTAGAAARVMLAKKRRLAGWLVGWLCIGGER
jgi:hypothetical protein